MRIWRPAWSCEPAIIEAANQIVIPTFVSTLCICIVWLPLFQLSGVAGYLFLPMAEAIVFAMLASFILSRTLVPTLAAYLLPAQVAARKAGGEPKGRFGRFQAAFEQRFDRFRDRYQRAAGQGGCAAQPIHRRVPGGSSRLDRACWCPGWGAISSRVSSPARSTCISVRRSGCASKRPARSRRWWTPPLARCCRAMSPMSSTIAACRPAASTRPTARAPRSDRKTATSPSASTTRPRRSMRIARFCAINCRSCSPARASPSRPAISRRRS